MNVGVLLLAAGWSRRFGSDKRLALLPDGRPLLFAAVSAIQRSGLDLRVCLRPGDDAIKERLLAAEVAVLECQRAAEGMGATLADAVAQLGGWQGLLVALADMPGIRPGTFRAVAEALTADSIVTPTFQGEPGHPVGFGRVFFPALARLDGDRGARDLVSRAGSRRLCLSLADPGILRDVDYPADFRALGSPQP
ncbi:nucleotidyltransferase family protein [Haliea sp. E1-2-M8]|uniref:nucleotidyltransferase family protein n=1 Tax=Haliea sp. E1-2-M8 TaxID=3064706 RepID=UPI00272259B8|nr:nucleotidyltransferase family protein [Haliea sp. E1-2-M8]MDO8863161.1 nucleotidyltransferase family protein [Haliea sp. E1-2-M8]